MQHTQNTGHSILVIDAQNCFMDHPAGQSGLDELPVQGATSSAIRTASFMAVMSDLLDSVTLTFDSQANFGIERPGYWITREGDPVPEWTKITAAMVNTGQVRPVDPARKTVASLVVNELARLGRPELMIWPRHGVLGTYGHNLVAPIAEEVAQWEVNRQRIATRVLKGTNPDTEHYSALEAEIPLPGHASTHLNTALAKQLAAGTGRLFVAGQASSHCVPATVRSLIKAQPGVATRLTILRDAMNPVTGFEAAEVAFFEEIERLGGEVITCKQAIHAYGVMERTI